MNYRDKYQTSLFLNDLSIHTISGLYTPKEIWSELTNILLDYNICCEPLDSILEKIIIPED